jgi:Mrp family chromosome partitioning ATPase
MPNNRSKRGFVVAARGEPMRGRPFGPIRAETREAKNLALFLRRLARNSGKTLEDLAGALGMSKSTVSVYLAGKVPTEGFVISLVGATTRDQRDRTRALQLLRAARDPAPVASPMQTARAETEVLRGQLIEVYQRLTHAQDQRDELRETLDNSTKLIMMLWGILQFLQQQVDQLNSERDRLRSHSGHEKQLFHIQQRLVRSEEQERQARTELDLAQDKRREADLLLIQVRAQVRRLTAELEELRARAHVEMPEPPGRSPVADASVAMTEDQVAEDIDGVLSRVSEINAADTLRVERIRQELVQPALGAPAHDAAQNHQGRILTFYSSRGETGRTMAVANCAWILASNGFRVLMADWDLESPDLHRYFRPFLEPTMGQTEPGLLDMIYRYASVESPHLDDKAYIPQMADISGYLVRLDWPGFPSDGCLDFLPAGKSAGHASGRGGPLNWNAFLNSIDGVRFLDALGRGMRRRYDYVLLDCPSGNSESLDLALQMPDDLVFCFTYSSRNMEGAARSIRRIREQAAPRNIRILPVPMRSDVVEMARVEANREWARDLFRNLPQGLSESGVMDYWNSVEIPESPYYSFTDTLAAFGDRPGMWASLLAAYERLIDKLTDGHVTRLPEMSEEIRRKWLEAFDLYNRPRRPEMRYPAEDVTEENTDR